MKCPADGAELRTAPYEADIQVDSCAACGGVWLDVGELERIEATVEKDYREALKQVPRDTINALEMARQQAAPDRQCPRCDRRMEKREHGFCSQIIVDVCPSCRGVWLDRGELAALEVFFERSHHETAALRKGFWASLVEAIRRG